jgi:glucose/mannose-6-phosphate isomerase
MSGKVDPFREEVARLPEQMLWEPEPGSILAGEGRVVLCALGGSALAGDYLALALAGRRPVTVVREPDLPGWVTDTDSVLCMSFSGETRETLGAWSEAARRGLVRGAVASGGSLLTRAREEGQACCAVPAGLSPRSSLGYLLRAGAAITGDPVPPRFWSGVADHLRSVRGTWMDPDEDGVTRAAALAWRLHGRLVAVVSEEEMLDPAARRWVADLAENAEVPAVHWKLPEAAHNAIMVLAREAPRSVPVVLVALGEPAGPERRARWGTTLELLAEVGGEVHRVPAAHPDPWVASLGLAHAGDWVSVAAAELEGVSAASLSLMNELKRRLG